MPSSHRQLILCPADAHWVPPGEQQWQALLQSLGVLGNGLGDGRYLIGDAFLQWFSFMGCAPNIEFEPGDASVPDWQSFIFIQLYPPMPQPRWLVDTVMAKPACPDCQRRQREWMQNFDQATGLLRCPHCQHAAPACAWRWYDAGGCARQFISVANVYPKESMPTEALLSQLQQDTGTAWLYFYLHAPLLSESLNTG